MADGFVLSKKAGPDRAAASNQAKVANAQQLTGPSADDGYTMHKVRKERIWIEAINAENRIRNDWQENWSFLADYDQKGNTKEKIKLPEKVNMFSEEMPNTCAQVYGSRLGTELGLQMASMQSALSVGFKKKRNNDLICYD